MIRLSELCLYLWQGLREKTLIKGRTVEGTWFHLLNVDVLFIITHPSKHMYVTHYYIVFLVTWTHGNGKSSLMRKFNFCLQRRYNRKKSKACVISYACNFKLLTDSIHAFAHWHLTIDIIWLKRGTIKLCTMEMLKIILTSAVHLTLGSLHSCWRCTLLHLVEVTIFE